MPLHDAVLLDEHDELLRCIDAWLAQAHDWQPVNDTDDTPTPELTVYTQADPSRRVSLVLPDTARSDSSSPSTDTLLTPMPALPQEWQSVLGVQYHKHSTALILDRVSLGVNDLERLAGGALVVLPASFEPRWQVTLESSNGAVLPAILDASSGSLDVPPSPRSLSSWLGTSTVVEADMNSDTTSATTSDASSSNERCTDDDEHHSHGDEGALQVGSQPTLVVALLMPVSINLRAAEAAWQSGMSLSLEPLPPVARLQVSLRLVRSTQNNDQFFDPVRHGSLLRIGQGLGVIIDSDATIADDQ